ncbi:MAG: type I methionyl aminopeptidase [Bifidobacteriaceae bacterium]|jgi:methionyl aminopeptidase|nr:type I methionyl aminopeptidase [Bifidobacteriaceae bacterium]
MIELKTDNEIDKMAITGSFIGQTLQYFKKEVKPGWNLLDIDKITKQRIDKAGAKSSYVDYAPDFGSGPFGHYICTSVNNAVLHGLPYNYTLQNGDLLSLDLAVSINGWTADSAVSFIVKDDIVEDDAAKDNIAEDKKTQEDEKLILATEIALQKGIESACVGNKISDISYRIGQYLISQGYGVNTDFGGHGVGRTMHEEPHIPNNDVKGHGFTLAHGMTFAIEPWILAKTDKYIYGNDGWTLLSADGSKGAHSEHTIAITKSGPRILTLP